MIWKDHSEGLALTRAGRVLLIVQPEQRLPGMWRVRWPDERLSDLVNLTRAKDAALVYVEDAA